METNNVADRMVKFLYCHYLSGDWYKFKYKVRQSGNQITLINQWSGEFRYRIADGGIYRELK